MLIFAVICFVFTLYLAVFTPEWAEKLVDKLSSRKKRD